MIEQMNKITSPTEEMSTCSFAANSGTTLSEYIIDFFSRRSIAKRISLRITMVVPNSFIELMEPAVDVSA